MHASNPIRKTNGVVRRLDRQDELPLLREHLLRLDPDGRRDRFNGVVGPAFIERYAAKCASDGTLIIAYLEGGAVKGAAELHPPQSSPDNVPEVAFSVERDLRRHGIGSALFKRLIEEARERGFMQLRVTTGAGNEPMRALASKFGARLTFCVGESTGIIELKPGKPPVRSPVALAADAMQAAMAFNRTWWRLFFDLSGARLAQKAVPISRTNDAR